MATRADRGESSGGLGSGRGARGEGGRARAGEGRGAPRGNLRGRDGEEGVTVEVWGARGRGARVRGSRIFSSRFLVPC